MARYILHRLMLSASHRARDESGQVLMIAALLMPILLGMAAMAVDIGGYAAHRRQLQNAADAIALAASKDLPSESAAQASAMIWADKNDIEWEDVNFQVVPVSAGNPNPKVVVKVERDHEFSFMKVLGIDEKDVGAKAAAIKTSPAGLGGLMPWSVKEPVVANFGDVVTVKYDANNPENGNFGPMRFDGSGGSTYLDTIYTGSQSIVCAEGTTNCTTVSEECEDSECPTETGNKVGPTRTGVDYRMDNNHEDCDSFEEVFIGPVDGRYAIDIECNPWIEGGKESNRVVIVPIIDKLCNGTCDVTVTGFALFWLEGYDSDKCTGNVCEIKGRFIQADVTVNALAGVYDESSGIHFTRLVE